ncbi:hypothetical protein LSAT2_001770 [Lamellibrachia satsuma]|nr:hypothetical protein LSAT2_001770 [Lamellibrachia satsuma]
MYASGIQAKSQKEKYESPNPRRTHTIMSTDDIAAGKKSRWYELEITGPISNVSPQLWELRHLTSLYLNDNNLVELPAEVEQLTNLVYLDLSHNRLQYLPAEIGEMVLLRELLLSYNHLRELPYELGKLFQLQTLGLKGNPLSVALLELLNAPSGTQKLLMHLLDNLTGEYTFL